MGYDFSADEVFQMAIQMEKNGAAFYRKAAEAADDAENKAFLLELADMEVEHEKTFTELRQQLTDREKASTVFDPEGEAAGAALVQQMMDRCREGRSAMRFDWRHTRPRGPTPASRSML